MASCGFIKASGEACKALPMKGEGWCYVHHPHYQERRRRDGLKGGKRGGRGRPMTEVHELRAQLEDLYTSVLTGMLDTRIGTTLAQIANARIRLVETELKA